MVFKLDDSFVSNFADPDWGYPSGPNSLGELTFIRTYSREKDDGSNERFVDSAQRVINGTYELQRRHQTRNGRKWDSDKAQRSAREAFSRLHAGKWGPPGRGWWAMGTEYVMERDNGAPLNNCGYISTAHTTLEDGSYEPAYPYWWIMTMLMLGVGIGADLKGAGQRAYIPAGGSYEYVIPDTREGWADSTKALLDAYFMPGRGEPAFVYEKIRKEGEPIKGFGGVAPGPEPLMKLHNRLRKILNKRAFDKNGNNALTTEDVADIVNMIGACVVAGGVRRSAEILLGDPNDGEFLNLKNRDEKPERQEWAWTSNNSIVVNSDEDIDWDAVAERIADNGEPGVVFMDNIHKYGRMGEEDTSDSLAVGVNPCGEQPLESGELCCLVDIYPDRCDDLLDFIATLKYAYLYAKTVTLVGSGVEETDKIIEKNRRIGASISGVVQFIEKHGKKKLRNWLRVGYNYLQGLDKQYSRWLGVNESIRTTTVKPSGTTSLLWGQTPGAHFPVKDTYLRRIRIQSSSPLVDMLREAGYHVEPDKYADNTMVVEIPIRGNGIPSESEVSIWDKAEVAAFMAENWSDNAVSITVTFLPEERGQIADVLRSYRNRLKTISFLEIDTNAYEQMPYESITEEEYERLINSVDVIDYSDFHGDGHMEKFCTTDACDITAFLENAS